jgi:hypothetical protein
MAKHYKELLLYMVGFGKGIALNLFFIILVIFSFYVAIFQLG